MGFSVTASHVIFLGTLLAAAVTGSGAYFSVQKEVTDDTREDWRLHEQRTWSNMTVSQVNYESGPQRLTVTMENEGTTVLDVTRLEFVVDGLWRTDRVTSTTVEGNAGTAYWLPGETLEAVLQPIPAPGTDVRVTTENGAAAYG